MSDSDKSRRGVLAVLVALVAVFARRGENIVKSIRKSIDEARYTPSPPPENISIDRDSDDTISPGRISDTETEKESDNVFDNYSDLRSISTEVTLNVSEYDYWEFDLKIQQ